MSRRAELLRWALKRFKRFDRTITLPIPQMRRRLRAIERVVPGPPRGTETAAVDAAGIPALCVTTKQARHDRYVLYFHGGGYVAGTAPLFRDFTWRIGAVAQARVLYFDYRLAPEHPFPAALEDACRVYRWLTQRVAARHIAFLGDSAGGGLLIGALYRLRDTGVDLPCAAVALSPWTDLALTGQSLHTHADSDPILHPQVLSAFARHYLGEADPRHPYASPIYGDAAGLPPILIQAGGDELLRDDAVRMAERLEAAGCTVELEVWPRMPHAWHHYARILPEARRALDRVGAFLLRHL
jgi:acetyl esterase/lipase